MIIDHKVYKHIISIPADTDSDNIRNGNLEAFSLQYSITPSLSISHELCGVNVVHVNEDGMQMEKYYLTISLRSNYTQFKYY